MLKITPKDPLEEFAKNSIIFDEKADKLEKNLIEIAVQLRDFDAMLEKAHAKRGQSR